MNPQLLIAAAGSGDRLGANVPKALVPIAGTPMIARTLRRFEKTGLVDRAVILVPPGEENRFEAAAREELGDNNIKTTPGGTERQHSIAKGLDALDPTTDIVIIHDAARPFVDHRAVEEAVDAANTHGAATVAVPCADTILKADDEAMLLDTPDRSRLWACQTPQVFRVEVIRDAHAQAASSGALYTDDATMVRACGGKVAIVNGSPKNFKITTPEDLAYAEYLIKENLV